MAADTPPSTDLTRRRFLALTGTAVVAAGGWPGRLPGLGPPPIVEEPFAAIVPLGEGIWAVVSTPLEAGDFTTVCNGGIVAGSERVLAVEGFAGAEGAAWVAEQAGRLTGRRPTDVLVTHFHGDHTGGLAGYLGEGAAPTLLATVETVRLTRDSGAEGERLAMLEGARILPPDAATELDLGGRGVRLVPRSGHTPSDVTVEVADSPVLFGGDLLWNGFFPNYRDTTPSRFAASIRDLRAQERTTWVPGHGPLADRAAVERLLAVVELLADHAARSHERGLDAAAAAETFELPPAAAEWHLFSPSYFEVAIGKVYAELEERPPAHPGVRREA